MNKNNIIILIVALFCLATPLVRAQDANTTTTASNNGTTNATTDGTALEAEQAAVAPTTTTTDEAETDGAENTEEAVVATVAEDNNANSEMVEDANGNLHFSASATIASVDGSVETTDEPSANGDVTTNAQLGDNGAITATASNGQGTTTLTIQEAMSGKVAAMSAGAVIMMSVMLLA